MSDCNFVCQELIELPANANAAATSSEVVGSPPKRMGNAVPQSISKHTEDVSMTMPSYNTVSTRTKPSQLQGYRYSDCSNTVSRPFIKLPHTENHHAISNAIGKWRQHAGDVNLQIQSTNACNGTSCDLWCFESDVVVMKSKPTDHGINHLG